MQQGEETELQQEAAAIQSITPVRSDEQISSEIRRLFSLEPSLAVERIEYRVDEGVVFLDGTVRESKQSMLAESLVRRVIGVHQVVNRLETL